MLKRDRRCKTAANGFTLIELSIVMVIVGLLSAALLNLYNTYNKQKAVTATADNIKDAQAALQKYQDDNGFYPCPADPTDPIGRATNCALPAPPGIKVVTGTGGREIRIGVMPIMDMSGETKLISGSQAVDGWRRRLTYAVTQGMALNASTAGQGAIIVQDAETGAVITPTGNIIVLSHGEDGAGGYNANGVEIAACPSGTKDAENCNDDAVFVAGNRSYAHQASYNDDFVEFTAAASTNDEDFEEILYDPRCERPGGGLAYSPYVLMTYAEIQEAVRQDENWTTRDMRTRGSFSKLSPNPYPHQNPMNVGQPYTYTPWPFPAFSGKKLVRILPCSAPALGDKTSEPGAQ